MSQLPLKIREMKPDRHKREMAELRTRTNAGSDFLHRQSVRRLRQDESEKELDDPYPASLRGFGEHSSVSSVSSSYRIFGRCVQSRKETPNERKRKSSSLRSGLKHRDSDRGRSHSEERFCQDQHNQSRCDSGWPTLTKPPAWMNWTTLDSLFGTSTMDLETSRFKNCKRNCDDLTSRN